MKNDLYRKLTSITLMTIMFAGGMTIAIPGELPTAVAQTNTLSVSASVAGVIGGAQVVEIVINDPDRDEANDPEPDVEIDEKNVKMTQSTTGKWYAYVADDSFMTSGLQDSAVTIDDFDAAIVYSVQTGFLTGAPTPMGDADTNWPFVQVHELDGDVEITTDSDQSVTLDYDDHSDIATISVDRNDVPVRGQVHITISDFQLNLDPINDDIWTLTDGVAATYNNVLGTDDNQNPIPSSINLTGTSGELGISGSDTGVIVYSDGDGVVIIEETGSNTGVFESSDGKDNSEISVKTGADSGDTFTIAYADDDQQIIVDDFDSTLELIADGTWDSSEPLTIRLTNENLDLNTLDDHDMALTDDDLAVLVMGDPITLDNVRSVTTDHVGDAVDVNPRTFVVTLNATTDSTPVNVVLTSGQLARLTDSAHSHYIHYIENPAIGALTVGTITTDADILDENGEPIDGTSTLTVDDDNRFQQIAVNPDADGRIHHNV